MSISKLNFQTPVARSFGFLLAEYEFELAKSTEFLVRYESAGVFVEVCFDGRRSYELDVKLGERNISRNRRERSFGLAEILRLQEAPEKDQFRCIQVNTQLLLDDFVEGLAARLKRHGKDFLLGSKEAYAKLGEQRAQETAAYGLESHLAVVRKAAKKAWEEKDFTEVANLYESIEQHILPSEKKKLEYARKGKWIF